MNLTDKIALVTGSGRGIGRGIAMVMADHGADMVIADMDIDAASEVATEIEAMGRESMSTNVVSSRFSPPGPPTV